MEFEEFIANAMKEGVYTCRVVAQRKSSVVEEGARASDANLLNYSKEKLVYEVSVDFGNTTEVDALAKLRCGLPSYEYSFFVVSMVRKDGEFAKYAESVQ